MAAPMMRRRGGGDHYNDQSMPMPMVPSSKLSRFPMWTKLSAAHRPPRILLPSICIIVVTGLYLTHTPQFGTPATAEIAGTAVLDGGSTPTAVDELDTAMAEFAYENQKGERSKPVSADLASFGANWPCFWGETAVGDLDTFENRWDKFKDGWKYVCGLSHLAEPCVVYSLGSSGNMAFERDLLRRAPFCEVHVFDKKMPEGQKAEWFPDDRLDKVTTHEMFIATEDDLGAKPPRRSIPSIMAELNHDHIDILKMDIEGAEWGIFSPNTGTKLNFVGQLQLEVHTNLGRKGPNAKASLAQLFDVLEGEGLRLFHKEPNFRYASTTCIEFAFIQKEWSPSRKVY